MKLWHYLYAKAFGYSWLTCPMCSQAFGDHQEHGTLCDFEGIFGADVCPNCTPALNRIHELQSKIVEQRIQLRKQQQLLGVMGSSSLKKL